MSHGPGVKSHAYIVRSVAARLWQSEGLVLLQCIASVWQRAMSEESSVRSLFIPAHLCGSGQQSLPSASFASHNSVGTKGNFAVNFLEETER